MFLIRRVCFKPVTWYIEMHHVRAFFSVWRHGFFVLCDIHSQCVYLQEEISVHFNVARNWFEANLWLQKRYSEGGKKIRGCRGLLGRVILTCNSLY